MELYATIRETSKYGRQGLDPATGKPCLFRVQASRFFSWAATASA